MSYKACPLCQSQNAVGNRSCVKCGRNLLYEPILNTRKKGTLKLYMMERFFSSVLAGCAVVSVFFALMAILNQPEFMLFQLNQMVGSP